MPVARQCVAGQRNLRARTLPATGAGKLYIASHALKISPQQIMS